MTAGGRVAAVIVDDRGRVRRNIFRGTIKAGPASLVWNGRDDAGAPLPDGSYRLLLAATAGAMPSMTLRTTLRIDRTPPRVVLPPRLVATSSRTSVSVGVVLFLSEAATVRLRVGGRMLDTSLPAGRSRLMLKGASLGLGPLSARRSLRLVAVASDATGNATVDRAQLQVAAAPPGPIRPPDRPGGHGPGGNPGPPVTSSRMLWPVPGAINSPFGMRTLNGVTRPHEGLDLNARSGDPIRAAAAGSIIYQGNRMDGYGNLVIVQHANGMTTRYAHQSAFPTAQVIGDRVRRGQVIGYVGCTGSCFGDHLHFEVRINEIAVDPRSYLQVR